MRKPFRKSYISPETLFIATCLAVANIVLLYRVAVVYDAWWLKATTIAGLVCFGGMIFTGFSPVLSRAVFHALLNLTLFSFFGWGFSHVGNLLVLPFAVFKWLNLGLYYFLLFGLMMGAALRMGLHSVGIESKGKALVCACVVSVLCWMAALSLEARYVPGDVYGYVAKVIRRLPAGVSVDRLKDLAVAQTNEQLAAFTPTGTIGYMRWARNDGTIEVSVPGHGATMTYAMRQRGRSFSIRVGLSVVLLAIGMGYMSSRRRASKRPRPMFPDEPVGRKTQEDDPSRPTAPPTGADGFHSHSMVAGGLDEIS